MKFRKIPIRTAKGVTRVAQALPTRTSMAILFPPRASTDADLRMLRAKPHNMPTHCLSGALG